MLLVDAVEAYSLLLENSPVQVAQDGSPILSQLKNIEGDSLIQVEQAKRKILGDDCAIPDEVFCRLLQTSRRIEVRDQPRQIMLQVGSRLMTLFDEDEIEDFAAHYAIVWKHTRWTVQKKS